MLIDKKRIKVIGKDDFYSSIINDDLTKQKGYVIDQSNAHYNYAKRTIPFNPAPDLFIITGKDEDFLEKVLDDLNKFHEAIPKIILGHKPERECYYHRMGANAYIVPSYFRLIIKALKQTQGNDHYPTPNFWKQFKIDTPQQKLESSIQKLQTLDEEQLRHATILAQNPTLSIARLAKLAHCAPDTFEKKIRKIREHLGISDKRHLCQFLKDCLIKDG